MADDLRPLSPGDRWRPSARMLNDARQAADYVHNERRSGGALVGDRSPPTYTEIVTVANKGADDWGLYDIVGVCSPIGDVLGNPVGWSDSPAFTGYRLDSIPSLYNSVTGVTQKPIRAGKAGPVCIRGITPALVWDIEKGSASAIEYPSRDYVQVEKNGNRWMFRWAPGGDAKVLALLPPDSSQWYQDGTYNDQFLVMIDLGGQPDRVIRFVLSTATYPPYSIVPGSQYWLQAIPAPSTNQAYSALVPTSQDLYVTPGWTVSGTSCIPCRRVTIGGIYCCRTSDVDSLIRSYSYGVASGKLWGGLSGFEPVAQHFLTASLSRYTAPFYGWFRFTGNARVLSGHFTGGAAYLRDAYGNDFDGGTHLSVQYPLCQPTLESIGSGTYSGWNLKKLDAANLYFYGSGIQDGYNNVYMRPTPRYIDDPIGTIKLWSGSTSGIPPGWRLCDGTNGTVNLSGRFVMGYNAGGAAYGESTLQGTGGSRAIDGTVCGVGGQPVAFSAGSQRTDNRPPYVVLCYIQRTDA